MTFRKELTFKMVILVIGFALFNSPWIAEGAFPSVKTLVARSSKSPSSQVISFQANFAIGDRKFREVFSVFNENLYRIELFDESGKLLSDRLYKSQKAFLRKAVESTSNPNLQQSPLQPEILFFTQSSDRLISMLRAVSILPPQELPQALEPIKLIPILGAPSWIIGPSLRGNLAHLEQDTFRWRGLVVRNKFEFVVKTFETHLKNIEFPQLYSYAFGPEEKIDITVSDFSVGNKAKLFSLEPKGLGFSDFDGWPPLLEKYYREVR